MEPTANQIVDVINKTEIVNAALLEPAKEIGRGFADLVNLLFTPMTLLKSYKTCNYQTVVSLGMPAVKTAARRLKIFF